MQATTQLLRLRILVLFILLVSTLDATASVITIQGTVKGVDNKPLELAHVQVSEFGQNEPFLIQPLNADGTFLIELAQKPLYKISFSGVGHYQSDFPFFADGLDNVTLDLVLEPYQYPPALDSLYVIGDFNDFQRGDGRLMTGNSKTGFQLEIPWDQDSLAYQILGAEQRDGRSINGSQSDRFEYDGRGDYRSIIAVRDGKASIRYRRDSGPIAADAFKISSTPPGLARTFIIDRELKLARALFRKNSRGLSQDSTAALAKLEAERLAQVLKDEKNQLARQLIILEYMRLGVLEVITGTKLIDPVVVAQVEELMPADSPVWQLEPGMVVIQSILSGDTGLSGYFTDMISSHPSPAARAEALYNGLEYTTMTGQKDRAAELYSILLAESNPGRWGKLAKSNYSKNRTITSGKQLPQFKFAALANPADSIDNQAIQGKYVLIDFWALWCGPCLAELDNLHKVYKQYKNQNFEILSVSFDKKPADVAAYRTRKWPMPWMHASVPEAFKSPAAKTFEALSIPKPILIGPDGTILASDIELRGAALETTLARHIQGTKE